MDHLLDIYSISNVIFEKNMQMARVVIRVTMEKDGKKVVAVRSSIDIHNQLPHQLAVFSAEDKKG